MTEFDLPVDEASAIKSQFCKHLVLPHCWKGGLEGTLLKLLKCLKGLPTMEVIFLGLREVGTISCTRRANEVIYRMLLSIRESLNIGTSFLIMSKIVSRWKCLKVGLSLTEKHV